jgi:hypothetical protein
MYNLNSVDQQSLIAVSSSLGVSPKSLYTLIDFESRWNPKIKNPRSSARGLIQFINRTARGMGYSSSLDLVNTHPTIKSQLEGPVYRYLKQYKPFPNDQALFMSVFYPDARYWNPKKWFPYEPVRRLNPGINTPEDYVRKVKRLKILPSLPPFLILIGIGTILYITYTKKKKGGTHGTTEAIKGRK